MPPRAIVLLLDQLSRRCLGCYGHEWIDTPNLDRLASRSVVFDHCYSSPAVVEGFRNAAARLRERLQGDASTVVDFLRLDEATVTDASAVEVLSAWNRLLDDATARLERWRAANSSPCLMWMELPGIGWPGVAAPPFVELYAEELTDDMPDDLRELREVEVAYAALLSQFDAWLGRLLDRIHAMCGDSQPLFVMTAPRGEPLGELDRLAPLDERGGERSIHVSPLRDEFVHVPLLITGMTKSPLGQRRSELVTPGDPLLTLADWFAIEPAPVMEGSPASLMPLLSRDNVTWREELLLRADDGTCAIRTTQALLVQVSPSTTGTSPAETSDEDTYFQDCALFRKPEDLWEVNNIADQHPDQARELWQRLRVLVH